MNAGKLKGVRFSNFKNQLQIFVFGAHITKLAFELSPFEYTTASFEFPSVRSLHLKEVSVRFRVVLFILDLSIYDGI